MEQQVLTIQDVAEFLGISPRAVQFKLQACLPIPGVASYHKLNPNKKTSAYVIYADETYRKPRKKKKK